MNFITYYQAGNYFVLYRTVLRLGSSTPFSADLQNVQKEIEPSIKKFASCSFKKVSFYRLFRDYEFDWCYFKLVRIKSSLSLHSFKIFTKKFKHFKLFTPSFIAFIIISSLGKSFECQTAMTIVFLDHTTLLTL